MHDPATTSDNAFTTILEAALRARSDEGETPPAGHPSHAADPQVQQAIDDLLSSPAFVPVGKLAQLYSEDRAAAQVPQDLYRFLADECNLTPILRSTSLESCAGSLPSATTRIAWTPPSVSAPRGA